MKDRSFLYIIGGVGILSWILYFLAYYSHYKMHYIVEGLISIVVATVVYFVLVASFFRGNGGKKVTGTTLGLIAVAFMVVLAI